MGCIMEWYIGKKNKAAKQNFKLNKTDKILKLAKLNEGLFLSNKFHEKNPACLISTGNNDTLNPTRFYILIIMAGKLPIWMVQQVFFMIWQSSSIHVCWLGQFEGAWDCAHFIQQVQCHNFCLNLWVNNPKNISSFSFSQQLFQYFLPIFSFFSQFCLIYSFAVLPVVFYIFALKV